jgi:hypothetical protein
MFMLWVFRIYVSTFQQHLQMEYTSLSWNDIRLHQDRLLKFCYPLSSLCFKSMLIYLVCTDCRTFHLSSLMTCNHVWHMTGVSSMMNATCRTGPYLSSWVFVSNSNFNGAPIAHTLVFYCGLLFAFCSLTLFVLRYVSSGYTNVVFRLSLYSLGFKLSLYLVRILYFVGLWIIIRLHQSKQTHSTTCQALLLCKYQIPSSFPCCCLQNMNKLSQWSFWYSTILCEI